MRIQLEGEIKFGTDPNDLTDYSDEVSSLVLTTTRAQVERPATYGVPRTEQRLGARSDMVTLNFFSDESVPDGLWAEFYAAATTTDSGEVYFSAKFADGPTSATNPLFTGILAIAEMDTGTTVGEWKQQSKTYPARSVQGPLDSDPGS